MTAIVVWLVVLTVACLLGAVAWFCSGWDLYKRIQDTRESQREHSESLCRLREDVDAINPSLSGRLKRSPGATPLTAGEQLAAAHAEAAKEKTTDAQDESEFYGSMDDAFNRAHKVKPTAQKGISKRSKK